MTTFFTIFFIIIAINVVLVFFNFSGTNQKTKESTSKTSISDIHQIDLISSKYKKAV